MAPVAVGTEDRARLRARLIEIFGLQGAESAADARPMEIRVAALLRAQRQSRSGWMLWSTAVHHELAALAELAPLDDACCAQLGAWARERLDDRLEPVLEILDRTGSDAARREIRSCMAALAAAHADGRREFQVLGLLERSKALRGTALDPVRVLAEALNLESPTHRTMRGRLVFAAAERAALSGDPETAAPLADWLIKISAQDHVRLHAFQQAEQRLRQGDPAFAEAVAPWLRAAIRDEELEERAWSAALGAAARCASVSTELLLDAYRGGADGTRAGGTMAAAAALAIRYARHPDDALRALLQEFLRVGYREARSADRVTGATPALVEALVQRLDHFGVAPFTEWLGTASLTEFYALVETLPDAAPVSAADLEAWISIAQHLPRSRSVQSLLLNAAFERVDDQIGWLEDVRVGASLRKDVARLRVLAEIRRAATPCTLLRVGVGADRRGVRNKRFMGPLEERLESMLPLVDDAGWDELMRCLAEPLPPPLALGLLQCYVGGAGPEIDPRLAALAAALVPSMAKARVPECLWFWEEIVWLALRDPRGEPVARATLAAAPDPGALPAETPHIRRRRRRLVEGLEVLAQYVR